MKRIILIWANGQRLRLAGWGLGTQNVASDRGIDVMKEVLEVSAPYQIFNAIARAKRQRSMWVKTVFALQDKNLDVLRDLNNRVKF